MSADRSSSSPTSALSRSRDSTSSTVRSGPGDVSRERVEEAAARVVALQMWQARLAAQRPVPVDIVEKAQAASANLLSAAY